MRRSNYTARDTRGAEARGNDKVEWFLHSLAVEEPCLLDDSS